MSRNRWITAIVASALALVLLLAGVTEIRGAVGRGHWTLYPAAGFALLAAVQIYRWVREQVG